MNPFLKAFIYLKLQIWGWINENIIFLQLMDKESLGEDIILYRKELVCEALPFKYCLYNQVQRHMEDRISLQKLNVRALDSDYLKGINFGYVGE